MEMTVYKNYNNSQINTDGSTISSKIWDIVRVLKFKTRLKSMALLITKLDENCIERAHVNARLVEFKKKCCDDKSVEK